MRTLALVLTLLLGSAAHAFTLAAFGDSLTTAPSYPQLIPADVHINLDYPGEATVDGRPRLLAWLQGGGTADEMIVLEGTNDVFRTSYVEADTVANLEAMILAVQAAGIQAVLVTPPPVIAVGREVQNQRAQSLSIALVAMGASHGIPVADVWSAFNQDPNLASLYIADGIHPNDAGNHVIAATILALPEPAIGALLLTGVAVVAARRATARR